MRVNADDMDCEVEPGITRKELDAHLRDTGLFFPVDPGADATLGGMAATRASGTMAVRYGTMRDCVLNLTAVMADGSVVRTGGRARKSSAGYDLTRLLVGSEGTLGITTALTLRLFGVPEAILAAVCPFQTLDGACRTVTSAIQLGLGLARIELLDALQIRAVNALFETVARRNADAVPGIPRHAGRDRRAGRDLQGAGGGRRRRTVRLGRAPGRSQQLWQARHDAYWAGLALRPGRDAPSPPMSASRCRALPNASAKPTRISTTWASSRPSSAMSATEISTSCRWSTSTDAGEIARVELFNDRLVRARARHGRHLHGRTWGWLGQNEVHGKGAWRRNCRYGCHKEGA